MSRSWLRDAKNVADLGAHCRALDWRKDGSWEREVQLGAIYRAKAAQPMPIDTKDIPFFTPVNIHDSYVVDATRTGDTFSLTLDSIWDHDFFHDLGLHLNQEFVTSVFSVQLVFEKVTCLRWMRHDNSGNLRFFQPKFKPLNAERSGIDTYHLSWFEQEEDRIQWLAMFHTFQPTQHRGFDSPLYLGVDCERATAIDRRPSIIEKHFGAETLSVWSNYRSSRDAVYIDREDLCAFLDSQVPV
jgi:hypothetical protein